MLAFSAAAALTFAAVGWYLDWYEIRTGPAGSPGRRTVSIDINGVKIVEDVNKGVQKGGQKLQGALEKHASEGTTGQTPSHADTARQPTLGQLSPAPRAPMPLPTGPEVP